MSKSSARRRLPASRPRFAVKKPALKKPRLAHSVIPSKKDRSPGERLHNQRSPQSRNLASRREFSTKRRGELAELAFTLKAASLGFAVSKPYGDSERYDFILDSRTSVSSCHSEQNEHHSNDCHSERRRSFAVRTIAAVEKPAFPRPSLHRIQVKCTTQMIDGLYRLNAHRRTNGAAVLYLPSEIDFLAACIIPEDTWYIIPVHAIRSASLFFRRRDDPKPGLYDEFREAWHLLHP
jgi:hypothetical protein